MAFGRRTLRSVLTIGALDVLIVFCWLFYRTSTITHNGAKQRSLLQVLHIQAESVCRPHQHVAFVKVQKAGSSTVQNIMYRFGTSKNLTFVLPKYGNYISYSTFVRDRDVMPLPVFAEKFDMTCNHVKYNRTAFEKFLPEDTSYVGIVRHPLSLLNSYIYYFLEHVVPGEDKLAEFLSDPRYYAAQRNVSLNLITNYFGLPNSHASNLTHIDAFITKLDNDFDMMMILELFDESLLLMKRMFCWNISDVLYVKKNERENKPSLNNLTVVARNKHRSVANADYLFYKHFYKKMQDKIFKAGADFQRELVFFREARAAVEKFCRRQLWRVDGSLRIAESPWQEEFEVTGEMCRMIMMSELELQDHVGVRQYGRMWSELHRKQFYH